MSAVRCVCVCVCVTVCICDSVCTRLCVFISVVCSTRQRPRRLMYPSINFIQVCVCVCLGLLEDIFQANGLQEAAIVVPVHC